MGDSTDDFVVRTTYGEGFREPSLFEYAGQAGDILFDNETGVVSTREVGADAYVQGKGQFNVDWNLRDWSASLTGHYTDSFID